MLGRKRCPVCHSWMHRFRNPDRYVCPDERTHAAILAAKEAARKRTAEGQARGRATQARRGPTAKQKAARSASGKKRGGWNRKKKASGRKTMDPGTAFVKKERAREQAKKMPRDAKGRFRKKNGK